VLSTSHGTIFTDEFENVKVIGLSSASFRKFRSSDTAFNTGLVVAGVLSSSVVKFPEI